MRTYGLNGRSRKLYSVIDNGNLRIATSLMLQVCKNCYSNVETKYFYYNNTSLRVISQRQGNLPLVHYNHNLDPGYRGGAR